MSPSFPWLRGKRTSHPMMFAVSVGEHFAPNWLYEAEYEHDDENENEERNHHNNRNSACQWNS